MEKITHVSFDGGVSPHRNGKFACYYGWVIKVDGKVKSEGKALEFSETDVGSCFVEFEALSRALMDPALKGAKQIVMTGDSQTVINLCSGSVKPRCSFTRQKKQYRAYPVETL